MAFNPELGSTSPAVLLDNAERLDKLVNGPAADVPDRGGDPLYSWRQMMAKNDEVRQNLIPLSKQYMTLAAAQADIANIPEGSTTYYRSPDDSSLAIEVMNVGGTLQPTGRKMPSQQAVDQIRQQINYDAVQILKSAYDEDGNVYLLLDEFGELFIANLGPVSVQEKFRKLDALIHKDRAANLHEFPDKNANVPAFIDELGDLYIAGLGPFSVAQK
ncbi:right-handed parallel beta-helix repeat-containing protein, partial [Klebsiella variicola]